MYDILMIMLQAVKSYSVLNSGGGTEWKPKIKICVEGFATKIKYVSMGFPPSKMCRAL